MTRRHWGALAVVAGVLLAGLGGVDLLGAAASETPTTTSTTTQPSSTTTTVGATTTTTLPAPTTTIEPGVGAVERFTEEYREALVVDDLAFLFESLHPEVRERYGDELCQGWIAREISQLEAYELTGPLIGPSSATINTGAGGTFEAKSLYSGAVRFTYQGTEFEDQAQFAVLDGSIYWLGICR